MQSIMEQLDSWKRSRKIKETGTGKRLALIDPKVAIIMMIMIMIMALLCCQSRALAQLPWKSDFRRDQLLDSDWLTVADTTGSTAYGDFQRINYVADGWKAVQLPHNWDDYGGYIRKKHGNLHGDCWYRKSFDATYDPAKASFLFFEGVSSYATVYLNGHLVGSHAGGRTSFSLEVSGYLHRNGKNNVVAVKVQHPAAIRDLPWVCGGCSDEVGFSEGSQPMGIFRPAHLIQTGRVRIIPFGVHIYNDTTVNEQAATLYLETTLKSYASSSKGVYIQQELLDKAGHLVSSNRQDVLASLEDKIFNCQLQLRDKVHLWSLKSPYLYQLKTTVLDKQSGAVLDELTTPYGIRWIKWPDLNKQGPKQFLLNGKPVFINGIAGYEHALGKSHAFTPEEIATRVALIRSMGFNAFRDAHQPHNLRFQYYWDQEGVLWWPQFSAHIWFDTPAFRKNFLRLLKDWVLERRNSPANIMWGLQNESKLPADFARKCVALIRSLDPTASGQRLITTCNGGEGTDWDVPQNWSGTYGGDPETYGADLKKEVLVGEYGGWRTLDLHTEGGFSEQGPYSIDSWCALLEKKIKLASQVRDSVCGQFLWLLSSHDNPGRQQAAEGFRDLDRIGPVNYKGLLTSWEEPTEAVYLYQSNYTSADTAPMIHIAAHEWAERWTSPEEQKNIEVYSNCDSVALYNGVHGRFLGTRTRGGIGTHFTWNHVTLLYNIIYAVGYFNGQPVVSDQVRLNNLPAAPKRRANNRQDVSANKDVLQPAVGYTYLYRYNCGGPAYLDPYGHQWSADRNIDPGKGSKQFGSLSWTAAFKGLPAFFGSQRYITDPIKGTKGAALFRTFRYGREQLKFVFPVTNGDYLVELYFVEPWWGIGSNQPFFGWRDFDVAINSQVVLPHLDIFKEAGGSLRALKKQVQVNVRDGHISINFPETYSGQGIISAIAIAKKKKVGDPTTTQIAHEPNPIFDQTVNSKNYRQNQSFFQVQDWLATGDSCFLKRKDNKLSNANANARVQITQLPPALFGAQWLQLQQLGEETTSINAMNNPVYWKAHQKLQLYMAIPYEENSLFAAKLKSMEFGNGNANAFVDTNNSITILSIHNNKYKVDSLRVYQVDLNPGMQLRERPWWRGCLIAFKPISQLQPPYDQKPEFTFGVDQAHYNKEGKLTQRDSKDCLVFPLTTKMNQLPNEVTWPVVTGVADFHSFQLKYAYEGKDSLSAKMELISADGQLMAEQQIKLLPTRKGKWNSSFLLTPTMINAGHYQLKINWQHPGKSTADPLYIYSMKLR